MAAVALSMGLTACSDAEGDAPVVKGVEREMTLTVKTPDTFRSRSGNHYGDDKGGLNTDLAYAIYRSDGTIVYSSEMDDAPVASEVGPGQWSLTVKLLSEDTYGVVFFADQFEDDDPQAPYTIDFNQGTFSVDYSKSMTVENLADDKADAFLLYQEFVAGETTSFTLKRPFCQVNIGSNEKEIKDADGYYHNVPTFVGLNTTGFNQRGVLPTVLNFKTGRVSGCNDGPYSHEELSITASDFDAVGFDFPINDGVQYMYMAYILAPSSAEGWEELGVDGGLTLDITLGKAPFAGDLRDTYYIDNMRDKFLANNRLIIAPPCTDLGQGGGDDPDPDPDPEKPGFVEGGKYTLNIIYDANFEGDHKIIVEQP